MFINKGPDRVPMDWRHHDSTTGRRMDSSLGSSRCSLFSNSRWFVDLLGRRHEGILVTFWYFLFACFWRHYYRFLGIWRVAAGCRLVCQCRHLDVAVMFVFLSPILSLLLSCQIWQESGSQRGFHQVNTETFIYLLYYVDTDLSHFILENINRYSKISLCNTFTSLGTHQSRCNELQNVL